MFEIKNFLGNMENSKTTKLLTDLEKTAFSSVLNNVLKDENTTFNFSEKQMMINCAKKFETSFVYLEDKGTFFGLGDDAYVTDKEGKKHYFKSIRVKSITYSENDVFVVITYQWTLEIDDNTLNEFLSKIKKIDYEQPIDSKFYRKYRKYFYIFGCSNVVANEYGNIEGYKNLVVNSDGIVIYRKFPLIQSVPAATFSY